MSDLQQEQEALWDAEAAARYDTPGEGMFDPALLAATADRLAGLAGGGAALELAIGTGRVALPLLDRGVPVSGIEISRPMVARLRDKLTERGDADAIPVAVGDLATTQIGGDFTLCYLVFNTIANLLTQEEQVECFRNAARHLPPGGAFVIELWVPELRALAVGKPGTVGVIDDGYVLVDSYDVLAQRVVSHHFRYDGRQARHTWTPHRYIWPAELDLMAQLAGFDLESRYADWQGSEFTADSPSHLSVYRLR